MVQPPRQNKSGIMFASCPFFPSFYFSLVIAEKERARTHTRSGKGRPKKKGQGEEGRKSTSATLSFFSSFFLVARSANCHLRGVESATGEEKCHKAAKSSVRQSLGRLCSLTQEKKNNQAKTKSKGHHQGVRLTRFLFHTKRPLRL